MVIFMITFDFFNDSKEELLNKFSQHFQLDSDSLTDFFINENATVLNLIDTFNINLSAHKSSNVSLICRHLTTTNNTELSSFRKHGILNLKEMLQKETPLSLFLAEHDISIDYDAKTINIYGVNYPILESCTECDKCLIGKETVCSKYSYCKLKQNLINLSSKLYYFKATVEFFLVGDIDEMLRYPCISRYPEILYTIENLAHSADNTKKCWLGRDWMNSHNKVIMLEFPTLLSNLETLTISKDPHEYYNHHLLFESCDYNYSDFMDSRIPQSFFDNYTLIEKFISAYYNYPNIYGSLLANDSVSPDCIKFYEVIDNQIFEI